MILRLAALGLVIAANNFSAALALGAKGPAADDLEQREGPSGAEGLAGLVEDLRVDEPVAARVDLAKRDAALREVGDFVDAPVEVAVGFLAHGPALVVVETDDVLFAVAVEVGLAQPALGLGVPPVEPVCC